MKHLIFILLAVLFSLPVLSQTHGSDVIFNTGKISPIFIETLNFAADAEASDAYAIAIDPVPPRYFAGVMFLFTANTANTGAATLNVNTMGAKTIKKLHDQDLATGDIEAGQVVVVVYDGTFMQLISQVAQ